MIENIIIVGDRRVSIIGMSDDEGELVSKMIDDGQEAARLREREACAALLGQKALKLRQALLARLADDGEEAREWRIRCEVLEEGAADIRARS